MTLHIYLPQDRLRALARGETLPNRTSGVALFADISGFTALTESLRESLGARQGAEELSKQLGEVYSALIAEVEKYGGSVIGFAGDAMMCWFDPPPLPPSLEGKGVTPEASGVRSVVACAFAMQTAIRSFPALALKVSIASGSARRFVVGDDTIRCLDTLAGATVARTAIGEQLANKSGDVLVDEATAKLLGEVLKIKEWRVGEDGEKFAVAEKLAVTSEQLPAVPITDTLVTDHSVLRPFIHLVVYEREVTGQGSFLNEFRPCVALFVRFTGIDYDSDSAEAELDAFIRQVQKVAERHDGTLLDITIGDKGSYAYVNFGALSAHEDDSRRAAKTALELMKASSLSLQIGITQGLMRVGAYGGVTRKSFSALGDDVNLAARLMTTASIGEILLSGHVYKAVETHFTCEPRPPLPMKGKAEPLPVFAMTGESKGRAIRLQEPNYALPMVGRQSELQIINDKLDLTAGGKGQVIGIVAEAGLGKSRLVAEVIRLAHKKGFVGYGGTCQSDGINTAYLAWKSIWWAFFDIDPDASLIKQMRLLKDEIEDRAPNRLQVMPLLNTVLDLAMPENDFTRNLEPQHRKSALTALFEDCLRAASKDEPLLIVVEDVHWIDGLSHDLLEDLAKALANCPICFVLAYRPPQLTRLQAPRLEALPQFTRIQLRELNQAEAEQAIRAKLAQLYPARSGAVPTQLVDKLMNRAQGNPFYLEELLNYLRDRGLDPRNPGDLQKIELPDSLHALVLSRIDQLSEHEKTTLRVACIVGRLFRAAWLTGYYPALGDLAHVRVDLDKLDSMDITPLDSEPELSYLFKHIVTHEVTYESLPFGLRTHLHERLARYLEQQIAAGHMSEAALLDTLVFHYTHSENKVKQRLYLQKAGQAALDISAFNTALDYFARLLELTPETDPTRSALTLQLADTHYRLGDFPAARVSFKQAQAAAMADADRASTLAMLGEMTSAMGDYTEASALLAEAVPLARSSSDRLTLRRALSALGANYLRLGKLDDAKVALEESVALSRELGDVTRELSALNRLGNVYLPTDLAEAERYFAEVQARANAVGNRELAMVALNNLGVVAGERKQYAAARDYIAQALALARDIGAQNSVALGLINLAECDITLGELSSARVLLSEGLALAVRLGALPWAVMAVKNFALLAYANGQTERALVLMGLARQHPALSSYDQHELEAALAAWGLDPAVPDAGMAKGAELDWDKTVEELLKE